MLPIDIPNQHPVVMIAAVNQTSPAMTSSSSKEANKIKVVGVCAPIANAPDSEVRDYGIVPEISAKDYFRKFEHREVSGLLDVTMLQGPKHGKLSTVRKDGGYIYYPEDNYYGDDRMTYLVKIGSETVKFIIFFKVIPTNTFGNTGEEEACKPKGFKWKISSLPTGTDSTTITYSNLLNSTVDTFKGFSDVPAGEVGTTTGRAKSKT